MTTSTHMVKIKRKYYSELSPYHWGGTAVYYNAQPIYVRKMTYPWKFMCNLSELNATYKKFPATKYEWGINTINLVALCTFHNTFITKQNKTKQNKHQRTGIVVDSLWNQPKPVSITTWNIGIRIATLWKYPLGDDPTKSPLFTCFVICICFFLNQMSFLI